MTTTYLPCETETCISCGGQSIDGVDQDDLCRLCATFAHNLRLMAAGVTRNKATGRYSKIGDTK